MSGIPAMRYSRRLTGQDPNDDSGRSAGARGSYQVTNTRTLPAGKAIRANGLTPSSSRDSQTSPAKSITPEVLVPKTKSSLSHARKREENHVKRPPNSFIFFRSHFIASRKLSTGDERDSRNVSMIAGAYWNGMSDEEKAPFERLAEIAKEEHARLYPNYKYAPAAPGQKKRKGSRTSKAERERCKLIASLMESGLQGSELDRAVREYEELDIEESASPSPRASSSSSLAFSTLEPIGTSDLSSDGSPDWTLGMFNSSGQMNGYEPRTVGSISMDMQCDPSTWLMQRPFPHAQAAQVPRMTGTNPSDAGFGQVASPPLPWSATGYISPRLLFDNLDAPSGIFDEAYLNSIAENIPFLDDLSIFDATADDFHNDIAMFQSAINHRSA